MYLIYAAMASITSFNFSSDKISNPPADVTCCQRCLACMTYLCQLDIVLVELLLHDLLEDLECELVRFEKGHLLA